ncbi:hypothetical protein B9Z55_029165 [Caenorhabditis nigoni]|uniref:Uncharacterized protein n=1 Tax=Caenorhabditis nigoni TaxID=1611254 RepID=A0A2G5S8U7_9PELO|nr:hypothetical protein B9Z55_029165 [Caenorhabditis nigoni]
MRADEQTPPTILSQNSHDVAATLLGMDMCEKPMAKEGGKKKCGSIGYLADALSQRAREIHERKGGSRSPAKETEGSSTIYSMKRNKEGPSGECPIFKVSS